MIVVTDEMIRSGCANLELQYGLGGRATVSAIYASMRRVDPIWKELCAVLSEASEKMRGAWEPDDVLLLNKIDDVLRKSDLP